MKRKYFEENKLESEPIEPEIDKKDLTRLINEITVVESAIHIFQLKSQILKYLNLLKGR